MKIVCNYPFVLTKYLIENFNGKSEFNTKNDSIKIETPDWINISNKYLRSLNKVKGKIVKKYKQSIY